MITNEIIKISSNTSNVGLTNKYTYRSTKKNSMCGDIIRIELITKNSKIYSIVGKEDFVGRCNFPTVLALSNGKTQEMQYWPGENTMNVNPYDENNTKRPIWLQLRAGDLTLSRTSVKEDKGKADSSIYGTNNDCEGEILVWFEVIPEEAWEALQEMELDEKEGKLKRWWQRAAVAAVLFVGFVLLLISFIFLFPTTPPCFLSIFFLFQKVVVPWMLVIIGLVQPHVKFIWCHWE